MQRVKRLTRAVWAFTALICLLSVADALGQGTLSNQVLALLSRINTWTATQTFQDFRLTLGIPSVTTNRLYGDNSANLYWNGALVAGSGGVTNPHNLLSSTHSDTLAASVTRGDVIIGNSTPNWSRLAIGGSGNFLRSNGTDVSWGTDGSSLTNLPAANLTGTIAAISGVNVTNLNASNFASGTVPLAQLSGILNAQIGAGAAIAYSKLNLSASIVNTDVSGSAAIAYSKLNLTGSVVNGDLTNTTLLFAKWASNGCVNLQVPQYNGAAWVCKSLATSDVTGAGTVTSVAMSVPSGFSISGSPITTNGTLALAYANATANFALIGPSSGAPAAPTFRALVNGDLPLTGVGAGTYPKVTINTAGVVTAASAQITLTTDVTGILPMANGGTGVGVSANNTVLVGSGAAWIARTIPDCTTGVLQFTQATNLFNCATTGGATHNLLSATHTDTVAGAAVRGGMIVANNTPQWAQVAIGTAGQLWTVNSGGTDPNWSNTIARGSLAASSVWNWTQTWNAGGVTFRGFDITITDTASAAGSTGFRVLGGAAGTTVEFSVDKSGNLTAGAELITPLVTRDSADLTVSTTTSGNIVLTPAGDIKWGKALVALGGGATATLGTIGATGPAAAAQNTWMRVLDSTGAAFWVPAWK